MRLGVGRMTRETSEAPRSASCAGVRIIYDGECPFCRAYVSLVRLREAAGPVELIDARRHPVVAYDLHRNGIDLNDTMAVQYGGRTYAGAEAVQMLSLLSSGTGPVNRIMAGMLRDRRRARLFYPVLRTGRNLTLRLLGRTKLEIRE